MQKLEKLKFSKKEILQFSKKKNRRKEGLGGFWKNKEN